VTPYLNFLTPICLFSKQLSWGYDDDFMVVYRWASP